FDRWGEGVVYLGIVIGALNADLRLAAILATAAMISAFMVSYARAKAESLGYAPGSGMANVGLAPREIRIVILTIGLIVAGRAPRSPALEVALGLIAVLATITVIQRVLVTVNQAAKQEQG